MLINLKDKVAIVTGAAQGIGKTIAQELANEGVCLALWDNDEKRLAETAKELDASYGNVCACKCDVSSEEEVGSALAKTLDRFGTIDILVANAGIANPTKFLDISEKDWSKVYDINVKGVFLCSKAVAPTLKKKKFGRIIIASSFAAIIPAIGGAAYGSSKAAVASLARVMAAELGPWNITVNAYAPGMIPSNMSGIEEMDEVQKNKMLNTLSIREWGQAKDIASLVIFLASDQARYITGSLIDASGGKFAVQFAEQAYEKNE
jgi:3-oxoacyl-[acyl-carrier protein] reductase